MQARDKKCESNEEESEEECPETKSKFRIWEGIRNARARKKRETKYSKKYGRCNASSIKQ